MSSGWQSASHPRELGAISMGQGRVRDDVSDSVSHDADHIADKFSDAWSTDRPRIEAYLDQLSDKDRDYLFERLLRVELQRRDSIGESVSADSYRRRFPQHIGSINQVFSEVNGSLRATTVHEPSSRASQADSYDEEAEDALPDHIGNYPVRRRLGRGAFGVVYLATHPELNRDVAIKVARAERFKSEASRQAFLNEAHYAVRMSHPSIVSVYDVDEDAEKPFIVQEYIEGEDLAKAFQRERPTPESIATVIADIAEALAHAHQHGIYHRDLKPSNILMDGRGNIHVADFGLAMQADVRRKHKGQRAGTPRYMAPEQVRGESHRMDGRSDLWSLGVMLYEGLVGRAPFVGVDCDELFDEILYTDPTPPRQIVPDVPMELERICLKCLSKKMTSRYTTAQDLTTELREFLADEQKPRSRSDKSVLQVVPKGLRAFDEDDRDFFLELLPGPRASDGMPETIRFWKKRIENRDKQSVFSVGLVYGPSGCGKSSIVKAGLLPRLSRHVDTIYLEATPADTELRLTKELHRRFPALPADLSLPDLLAALREGNYLADSEKLLIVFDQFEQWLHANRCDETSGLVEALRQCDGARLQAVILVRDDFWMAATRFLQLLEVELVEGENLAAVDRFDFRHAKKVLMLFGQAYGALPSNAAELTRAHEAFLDEAVRGLAEDNRVVSLRLALFAEMFKSKTWTPASLRASGGAEGIGVAFLEETFNSSTANPKHRLFADQAQDVLRQLLPAAGLDIKGNMKSYGQLLASSDAPEREDEFSNLLDVLDGELRLITPTDPVSGAIGGERSRQNSYYQLTHDYLVPSIRAWVEQKRRESRAGRAELWLAERTSFWRSRRERKQLPTWFEWLHIVLLTRRSRWSQVQSEMMAAATKHYMLRILMVAAAFALVLFSAFQFRAVGRGWMVKNELISARTADLPSILAAIPETPYAAGFIERERNRLLDLPRTREVNHKLTRLSLALLDDEKSQRFLQTRILESSPDEFAVIRDRLVPVLDRPADEYRSIVNGESGYNRGQRLRAASVLASIDAEGALWEEASNAVSECLVWMPSTELRIWTGYLQPVHELLEGSLRSLALSTNSNRDQAATALAYIYRDRPRMLVDLIGEVDPSMVHLLVFPEDDETSEKLQTQISDLVTGRWPKLNTNEEIRCQTNHVLAYMLTNPNVEGWRGLESRPNPSVKTLVIAELDDARLDTANVVDYLVKTKDGDHSKHRALVRALAEISSDRLPPRVGRDFVEFLKVESLRSSDPGKRAAAEYLLKQWKEDVSPISSTVREAEQPLTDGPSWRFNSIGQRMIRIPARYSSHSERDDLITVPYAFEVSDTEVTVEQFKRVCGSTEHGQEYNKKPDHPVVWFDRQEVMKFCRLLSENEGVPEIQMCYRFDANDGKYVAYQDIRQRTGYRLPFEDEWEVAARAGTRTSLSIGQDVSLIRERIHDYAWTALNSMLQTQAVAMLAPNELGLFDTYGNVSEFCVRNDGSLIRKGGSFWFKPVDSKVTATSVVEHQDRDNSCGMRIVRTVETK